MSGHKYVSLNTEDMIVELEEIPTAENGERLFRVLQRGVEIARMNPNAIGSNYRYIEASEHMDDLTLRLAVERTQLMVRHQRLNKFMWTLAFKDLDPAEQTDLRSQYEVMDQYLLILNERLARRMQQRHDTPA